MLGAGDNRPALFSGQSNNGYQRAFLPEVGEYDHPVRARIHVCRKSEKEKGIKAFASNHKSCIIKTKGGLC
jgi:hypothetical protein